MHLKSGQNSEDYRWLRLLLQQDLLQPDRWVARRNAASRCAGNKTRWLDERSGRSVPVETLARGSFGQFELMNVATASALFH